MIILSGSKIDVLECERVRKQNDQSGQFLDVVDRAYSYDAAGRLQHAYSGVEARNFVNNTSGGTPDGPYDHEYLYDRWGNLLQDSGRIWSRTTNTSDNYDVNNRVPTWSYDAEGNVLSRNEEATTISPFVPARYTYDVAGRQVGSTQTRTYRLEFWNEKSVFVNSQSFDGDNQMTHYALVVNATPSNPQLPPSTNTIAEAYLLRSTVLGGSVIVELKGDGTWSKTHVYAGDERLEQQTTAPVGTAQSILENLDPITGDGIKHLSNGSFSGMTTLDAGGIDVGVSDPFPPDGSGAEGGGSGALTKTVPFITPIEGGGAKCILDGLEIECSRVREDTASVQCPNNDCGTRTIEITARSHGRVVWWGSIIAPPYWDDSRDGTYSKKKNELKKPRFGRIGRQVFNHAGGGTPQNPSRVPFPGIDAVNKRLNTGDCNAYIATLIAKANELYGGNGNVTVAKDGLDLLSKISGQGGFVTHDFLKIEGWPVGGTVSGSIAGGTATVLLSTRFMYGNSASTTAMWQADYVSIAIHELVHLSAKYSGYDDTQLATAASKLPGAATGLPAPPKDYKDMKGIFANSDYYNRELMRHCGPPK